MPIERPQALKLSPLALFRYQVVSFVLALCLQGHRKADAVRTVAGMDHPGPDGPQQVAERTVYDWLKAYQEDGLAGLENKRRPRIEGSNVLSDELLAFLEGEVKDDPDASIPELLRLARQKGVLAQGAKVCRQTVWRALLKRGVALRRGKRSKGDDMRRFQHRDRMRLVMLDFKHFRAGCGRVRRLALYALDDATRFGLHVVVTRGAERASVVTRFLYEVICCFGLPDVLYVDRGPGFIADVITTVMAAFDVPVIIGRAKYPEARGKIERFNRSAKARVLRKLDRRPDVDTDPGALTLLLRHDLREVYNHLPHEALGGDSPYERWHGSSRSLTPVPSEAKLTDAFTVPLEDTRRVSNDHVVSVDCIAYEVPRGLARRKITIYRRVLECTETTDALYIEHNGGLLRVHPVDLVDNANSRRATTSEPDEDTVPAGPSASELSFRAAFAPMVGPDGGYPDTPEN